MTGFGTYARIRTALEDGVAVLTLASGKVNALDVQTLGELADVVDACVQDPDVRAVVLTGQGTVFSAGLDVGEVLDNDVERTGDLLRALDTALVRLFACPKPTVAAINGTAVAGGCILACACDKRLIAEGAGIGPTELQVGVALPVVAVELLRHACGEHAEQLLLDAVLVTGDDACRRGLAHRVVDAEDLRSEAVALAGRLAGHDAAGVRAGKGDDPQARPGDRRRRGLSVSRRTCARAVAALEHAVTTRAAPQAPRVRARASGRASSGGDQVLSTAPPRS